MKRYGIADVGSNTIVLYICHLEDGIPVQDYYQSSPVHLIQYVDSAKTMSKQGMFAALQTLTNYAEICHSMNCDYLWADITEPCRITNLTDFLEVLSVSGFELFPLTGSEEAECDYLGSRISCPEIHEGAAFDVGGGSTELITFENNQLVCAESFPLGCVRLTLQNLKKDDCLKEIDLFRKKHPLLYRPSAVMIGIGGTARNMGLVLNELHHTGNIVHVSDLIKLVSDLENNVPEAVEAMQKNVSPARQEVFLPGLYMIEAIAEAYEADTIQLSSAGIREGFLLKRIAATE